MRSIKLKCLIAQLVGFRAGSRRGERVMPRGGKMTPYPRALGIVSFSIFLLEIRDESLHSDAILIIENTSMQISIYAPNN